MVHWIKYTGKAVEIGEGARAMTLIPGIQPIDDHQYKMHVNEIDKIKAVKELEVVSQPKPTEIPAIVENIKTQNTNKVKVLTWDEWIEKHPAPKASEAGDKVSK